MDLVILGLWAKALKGPPEPLPPIPNAASPAMPIAGPSFEQSSLPHVRQVQGVTTEPATQAFDTEVTSGCCRASC